MSFYLKKNAMKEVGKCPVMARLSIGKYSETTFSITITIPVSLWASGRATGKSLAAIEINRRLDEIRASAVRENVTADDVKNVLLGMAFGHSIYRAGQVVH